jgi:hypothetical protein
MRKFYTLLIGLLVALTTFAQVPEKMSYQAVVRNSSGQLVVNAQIGMRITILQGSATGTAVYSETQKPVTNVNGLVSIEIGGGTGFNAIDWVNGNYFIKTETDPSGGTNYTITGTTQLLSVPFALHSKTAESLTDPMVETDPVFNGWNKSIGIVISESQISDLKHFTNEDEADPVFGTSTAKAITPFDTANWNNKSNFDGDYLSLDNKPEIPSKTSELANDAGFISDPDDADNDPLNELQVLQISNDTLYLTQGGFVKLPAGFDGQYSSLTGKPALALVATSGKYSDLAEKPTSLSQFANDEGFVKASDDNDTDPTNELQWIYRTFDKKIGITDGGSFSLAEIESDPLFYLSPAATISSSNILNWNNKLDSYSETDPLFSAWNKSTGISITESQISDLNHFTTTDETDPVFSASLANEITVTDTTRWGLNKWKIEGNNLYYSSGNVGIGTSDPGSLNIAPLNVEGGVRYLGGSALQTPGLLYYDPSGTGTFNYIANDGSSQVLGVGTINYTGTLWQNVNSDYIAYTDAIVNGSLAVGFDAVAGENFGFATILLKENNLRIKFDDTSSSAGFPANDWQLTANESASGGSNYFAIEDLTGAKIPFKVMAGANTDALYVSSSSNLGINTSSPVLDIHIKTGDTPGIRFEQVDGGWTPQTWDIAANESNFFIRDVTSGSKLPFRIRPGAPTSSIDISATGNVGIGTAAPQRKLHVMDVMRLEPAPEPATPGKGDLYFDSTTNKLRCYDGTIWHDLW